jgi:hypothetical protein
MGKSLCFVAIIFHQWIFLSSPIWWRILDVRPETKRVGAANMRAKEFVAEETLENLMPPKLVLKKNVVDEATNVVLNRVQVYCIMFNETSAAPQCCG